MITVILGTNVTLDGIGTNKLIVNRNEIILYRLPFFIKRIQICNIEHLDYVVTNTILGTREVVRMYYNTNRHIRISNYSVDSSIIKMKIEELLPK